LGIFPFGKHSCRKDPHLEKENPFFNDVLFDVFTVLGVYTLSLKVRGKFFVGCFQIFRDDPSLSDHGNKVGVAFPAGNDMEMQMTGNTSPRTFPHIESYIEAIGLVDLLQNLLAPAGQGHHLSQFRACRVGECSHMPVGNHQQVACRVGESIQNKEGVLLAKKNETLPILIRGGKKAKNTVRFLATRGEVMEAPGSPKVIHL
jgi:hypothetical protein